MGSAAGEKRALGRSVSFQSAIRELYLLAFGHEYVIAGSNTNQTRRANGHYKGSDTVFVVWK